MNYRSMAEKNVRGLEVALAGMKNKEHKAWVVAQLHGLMRKHDSWDGESKPVDPGPAVSFSFAPTETTPGNTQTVVMEPVTEPVAINGVLEGKDVSPSPWPKEAKLYIVSYALNPRLMTARIDGAPNTAANCVSVWKDRGGRCRPGMTLPCVLDSVNPNNPIYRLA